VISLLTR
jgi:maleylacetate reductase